MDIFLIEEKKAELELMKLEDFMESEINIAIIDGQMLSTASDSYYTESEVMAIYESKLESIRTKVASAIEHVIQVITDFISKSARAIHDMFTGKKVKDAIETCEKHADKLPKGTIEMLTIDKDKERLDNYIRELTKLERELLNVKVNAKFGLRSNATGNTATGYIIECNEILHKIDRLNDRYDSEFLDEHDNVIKMASTDAIRFSDKDLKKLRVDYDAIESGSKKILKAFKTDSKGCEVPEKLNVFSKLTNSLATRVRKIMVRATTYKKKNIGKILALSGAVLGAIGLYRANKAGLLEKPKAAISKEIQKHPKVVDVTTKIQNVAGKVSNNINQAVARTPAGPILAQTGQTAGDVLASIAIDKVKVGVDK